MLKINTVLTAACALLLAIVGFLGKAIWEDVATIKMATTTTVTKVDTIQRTIEDHETRIRQTERDVTILQQQEREDNHRAVSPKMTENKN